MTSSFSCSVIKWPHVIRGGATMPEWASVSIKEASTQSGYNEEYLRRLIRLGKLEAVKVGPAYLIRVESLNQYLAEMRAASVEDARAGPRPK